MKKVTLIELSASTTRAIGVRILSSVAKQKGYHCTLVFMCGETFELKVGPSKIIQYDKKIVDQVLELVEGSDLVGLSFLTNLFDRAVQLTTSIKHKLNIPIIWGGVHTTARPEEALQYADMACIGEGENTFGELLERIKEGRSYKDIRGIWINNDGNLIKNPVRTLEQDLDSFPFQDFEIEGKYFYNKKKMEMMPLTEDDFMMLSGKRFNLMMSRGCPYACSYCYNSTWKGIYKGQKYLRTRSVKNVIDELSNAISKFPFINGISLSDDDFFSKPMRMFQEFSEQYSLNIGLPLRAQITPQSLDTNKLNLLAECGLRGISMGVQTASNKINKIYCRPSDINSKIINGAQMLDDLYNKYKNDGFIRPEYDFIIDSYWETEDDVYETLELLLKFPKPYHLNIASLIPYPGTAIYERAKEENLIKDEMAEIYRRRMNDFFYLTFKRTFPNLLLVYYEILPNFTMKFLLRKKVRRIVSKLIPEAVLDKIFKFKIFFDKLGRLKQKIFKRDYSR